MSNHLDGRPTGEVVAFHAVAAAMNGAVAGGVLWLVGLPFLPSALRFSACWLAMEFLRYAAEDVRAFRARRKGRTGV